MNWSPFLFYGKWVCFAGTRTAFLQGFCTFPGDAETFEKPRLLSGDPTDFLFLPIPFSLCGNPPLVFSELGLSSFGGSQTSYSQEFFVYLTFTEDPTSLVVQWLGVHLPVQGTEFKPWLGNCDSHGLWESPRPTTETQHSQIKIIIFFKLLSLKELFMWVILINSYHVSSWNRNLKILIHFKR